MKVPTLYAGLIKFEGGQSAQCTFSFQSVRPNAGLVQISGTAGTISFPDPNMFAGDSTLWSFGSEEPKMLQANG